MGKHNNIQCRISAREVQQVVSQDTLSQEVQRWLLQDPVHEAPKAHAELVGRDALHTPQEGRQHCLSTDVDSTREEKGPRGNLHKKVNEAACTQALRP